MVEFNFPSDLDPSRQADLLASPKVASWLDNIQQNFTVSKVNFDKVYFFGRNVGFVMASVEAKDADGVSVPGLALVRGSSVAVLVILVDPFGKEWTVLTRQPRLPIGVVNFEEIPAGMLDGNGSFASKAIAELNEEVGADLNIVASDLSLLEEVYPSPGGSDESIQIFVARKQVSAELIQSLVGRRTGLAEEHENIRVDVIPLDDLKTRATTDMKARLAYYSYSSRFWFA